MHTFEENSEYNKKKLHRKLFIILFTIFLLLLALRLYLPTLARDYTNKELNKDPLYYGSVEKVRIHLWRGAYTFVQLKIERVEGQKTYPFLSSSEIDVGISWRELFKGSIVAKINAKKFMINVVREQKNENEESDTFEKDQKLKTWQRSFKNLVPLNVGRLIISDGEIHFRDFTSKPKIDVFLDQVAVDGYNLTNSSKISNTLFGTIDLKARAMKSGRLKMLLYINPTSTPVKFKLNTELTDLNLVEFNSLFTAYGNFDVKDGKFNIYSEIVMEENRIEGYLKPLIKDLVVSKFSEDKKKGFGYVLWEKVVGALGVVFKNFPHDQQAAKISFSGAVDNPNLHFWATAESIFNNIFIKALMPKIDNTVKLLNIKKKKNKK